MDNVDVAVRWMFRQLDLCGDPHPNMQYQRGTYGIVFGQLAEIAGPYPACSDQSPYLCERYDQWEASCESY